MTRLQHLQTLVPGYSGHRQTISDMIAMLEAKLGLKHTEVPKSVTLPERIELLENAVLGAAGVTPEPKGTAESVALKSGSARTEASIARYLAKIAPRPLAEAESKTAYARVQLSIAKSLAKSN